MYRVYTEVNYADTWRDPDDFHHNEIGYYADLYSAQDAAVRYIRDRFFHSDTKLTLHEDGTYRAVDCTSWGAMVVIRGVANAETGGN